MRTQHWPSQRSAARLHRDITGTGVVFAPIRGLGATKETASWPPPNLSSFAATAVIALAKGGNEALGGLAGIARGYNSAVRKLRSVRKAAPLSAAALGLLALAATADAQPEPPSEPPAASQSAEPISRIIATAIPNSNFVAAASRMATVHAQNGRLRELARDLAKDQTSVANSLTARVNVIGPVIARRPPSAGGAGGPNLSAPQLLPGQASTLRQLSHLRGPGFDALYVSSVKESLAQLQTLYRDVVKADGDAELRSLAQRELPKLEETISALGAM